MTSASPGSSPSTLFLGSVQLSDGTKYNTCPPGSWCRVRSATKLIMMQRKGFKVPDCGHKRWIVQGKIMGLPGAVQYSFTETADEASVGTVEWLRRFPDIDAHVSGKNAKQSSCAEVEEDSSLDDEEESSLDDESGSDNETDRAPGRQPIC